MGPWGNQGPSPSKLNLCGKQRDWEHTAPVGSYPEGASPFGVLDMAGNVWEWTGDDYNDYSPEPVTTPLGSLPDSSRRVIRGGGWSYAAPYQVGATMRENYPGYSHYDLGFRCARGPIHSPAFP